MKREFGLPGRTLRLGTLAAGLLLAHNAMAVGTPAGTPVDNTATATYTVNTIVQTPVSSPVVSFVVDQRVDFTLTEVGGAATVVTPGEAQSVTEFLLTNIGNAAQDFNLSVANLPNGTSVFGNADSDDVDAPFTIYVDDGSGVFDAADTQVTFVDELPDLAGSNEARLFVVATIPADAVNGGFLNIELTGVAHDAGGAGLGAQTTDDSGVADDPTTVQVVFADSGFDGSELAQDSYAVQSAALAVAKTSLVVADEFGSANPKAIPGSTVQYEITLTNSGTVQATGVGIIDPLDTTALTLDQSGAYGGGDAEVLRGGSPFATCSLDTDDLDGDGCGVFNAGGEVRIVPAGLTLDAVGNAPDNQAVARFRVTIN